MSFLSKQEAVADLTGKEAELEGIIMIQGQQERLRTAHAALEQEEQKLQRLSAVKDC